MNSHFRPPGLPYTTQSAEGLPRRLWTVAEIEAMVAAGIIDEDERFELIDGEVVPMSPKGAKHEHIKVSLIRYWSKRLPESVFLAPETTFRLDKKSFLEPDFVFYGRNVGLAGIAPKTILLAVEVADTSLRYDMGRKAGIYAAHGVTQLWVIDAEKLVTHVFTHPSAEGYMEKRLLEATDTLVPGFAPELALKLAELPLI
jgi:Uma2 family endonuclease